MDAISFQKICGSYSPMHDTKEGSICLLRTGVPMPFVHMKNANCADHHYRRPRTHDPMPFVL